MRKILLVTLLLGAQSAFATTGDYLVKFKDSPKANSNRLMSSLPNGTKVEDLGVSNWARVKIPASSLMSFSVNALENNPAVAYVQPNYKIKILDNPNLANARLAYEELLAKSNKAFGECPFDDQKLCAQFAAPKPDNPAIPEVVRSGNGPDPLIGSQWGMYDIGAREAWKINKGRGDIVVAVIDTGVDYTHEDLVGNLWRNPGETGKDSKGRNKATNGVDDDANGFIDDVIGWDFVTNDNKPYDLSSTILELLAGGNPGHGTHCAGNVAARGFNGKGISGVAPNVSIMSIRFLSEKGQGTTADAIKAVRYAVENRANILSNSWGSEGEEPGDPENEALKDVIRYAEQKGSLFVAAAGNGHQGVGYDNDSDPKPGYPASYDMENIVSVAAVDANDALGAFSNWGNQTVDIGAPGVKVFSTMVGNKYDDVVLNLLIMKITWDGTSMATPHVAGAAALYMSQNPTADWKRTKEAIIKSAKPIDALRGKSVSGGKLNLEALMNY